MVGGRAPPVACDRQADGSGLGAEDAAFATSRPDRGSVWPARPGPRRVAANLRAAKPANLGIQWLERRRAVTEWDVRNWRRRIWRPALEACELDPEMVPYDLRHSFASLLIHDGRDIAYAADQLGHSPAMTLATYTHVMRELQRHDRIGAEEQIR